VDGALDAVHHVQQPRPGPAARSAVILLPAPDNRAGPDEEDGKEPATESLAEGMSRAGAYARPVARGMCQIGYRARPAS
jgi:hypothetical protein